MDIFKNWEDVRLTRERIASAIHLSPVMTSRSLDAETGAALFFKCENLQKTGSFKIRGATNLVRSLAPAEAARGVATHSSGNHGAALACAAAARGVPAHIVMPDNSPLTKRAQVARYGAQLTLCAPTYSARKQACARVIAETGAQLAHSADDPRIIAGQATVGLELSRQVPDLDFVFAPIGGGGLAGGLVLASRTLPWGARIVAVEPEQAADAYRSLQSGILQPPESNTVADGLRTGLADRPFALLRADGTQVATVSEGAIIEAMKLLWSRLKLVIEPSGAVPFAAILEGKVDVRGKRVAVVLSGGNLDLDRLPWQTGPA